MTLDRNTAQHLQPDLSRPLNMVDPASIAVAQRLEERFEQARCRNWITDRMLEEYQHQFNCSRQEAISSLLGE